MDSSMLWAVKRLRRRIYDEIGLRADIIYDLAEEDQARLVKEQLHMLALELNEYSHKAKRLARRIFKDIYDG